MITYKNKLLGSFPILFIILFGIIIKCNAYCSDNNEKFEITINLINIDYKKEEVNFIIFLTISNLDYDITKYGFGLMSTSPKKITAKIEQTYEIKRISPYDKKIESSFIKVKQYFTSTFSFNGSFNFKGYSAFYPNDNYELDILIGPLINSTLKYDDMYYKIYNLITTFKSNVKRIEIHNSIITIEKSTTKDIFIKLQLSRIMATPNAFIVLFMFLLLGSSLMIEKLNIRLQIYTGTFLSIFISYSQLTENILREMNITTNSFIMSLLSVLMICTVILIFFTILKELSENIKIKKFFDTLSCMMMASLIISIITVWWVTAYKNNLKFNGFYLIILYLTFSSSGYLIKSAKDRNIENIIICYLTKMKRKLKNHLNKKSTLRTRRKEGVSE